MKNDIGCAGAAGACANTKYDPGTIATVRAKSINRILFIYTTSSRLSPHKHPSLQIGELPEIDLIEDLVKYLRVIDTAAINLDDKSLVHYDGQVAAFGFAVPLLETRRVADRDRLLVLAARSTLVVAGHEYRQGLHQHLIQRRVRDFSRDRGIAFHEPYHGIGEVHRRGQALAGRPLSLPAGRRREQRNQFLDAHRIREPTGRAFGALLQLVGA